MQNFAEKEMEKTQANLATQEISASSGGGMVTVVVTGDQQLKSIIIKPEAVSPDDVELLQDMVLAAVNEAMQKAKEMEQSKLGGLTGGLGLPGFRTFGELRFAKYVLTRNPQTRN